MNHGVPLGFLTSEHVPPAIMRWKCDGGSGTTLPDFSGNGYTGLFVGTPAPAWSSGVVKNRAINFLVFNGTTANVASASGITQLTSVQNASVCAWIFIAAGADNFNFGMMGSSLNNFGVTGISGTVYCYTANGAGNFPNFPFPSAGAWHFICSTFDGTQGTAANRVKGYVDGVLQTMTQGGVGNPTALAASQSPITIAYDATDLVFGTQSTADLQFFKYTLNQSQILALYNAGPQT